MSLPHRLTEQLLTPNLFGLSRQQVRDTTWRMGVGLCTALWVLLAIGLVISFVDDWTDAPKDAVVSAWLLWACSFPLLAASSVVYAYFLLRDGWRLKSTAWRLGIGGGAIAYLVIWVWAAIGLRWLLVHWWGHA